MLVPRGWPFPTLNYEYIFQIIYTEAILSNSSRKLLWFEIAKNADRSNKNKFIVLIIIISRTLSFTINVSAYRSLSAFKTHVITYVLKQDTSGLSRSLCNVRAFGAFRWCLWHSIPLKLSCALPVKDNVVRETRHGLFSLNNDSVAQFATPITK